MTTLSMKPFCSKTSQHQEKKPEARVSQIQMVSRLQEAATRTTQEPESMTLSARDCEVFATALLESPESGGHLKAAYRRYQERMG